jgi:hypothetical protein
MPLGPKARDASTRYEVYEFAVNGRVYYTGIGQEGSKRATDRWSWVKRQLDRLRTEGALPPRKAKSLLTPSVAVVRALIEMGAPQHDIAYPWRGVGRAEALRQEKLRVAELLSQGCVLANVEGNSRPASVAQVLEYLGFPCRPPAT